MSQVFGVYLHCRPNGEPFYVGKGTRKRARDFYSGRNSHHKRIVAKYGKGAILARFMECDSEDSALSLEACLIAAFRNAGFDMANYSSGGERGRGWALSEEAKQAMSRAKQGRRHSEEHKAAIGAALRGKSRKPLSEERRAQIGVYAKGKAWFNNGAATVFCKPELAPEGYVPGRIAPWLKREREQRVTN